MIFNMMARSKAILPAVYNFISIGRHTIPAIHCLMRNKDEELYYAVILKIKELFLNYNLQAKCLIGKRGSRNAFKHVYPGTRLYGCWFHYTQATWKQIQKYGLASSYRDIIELKSHCCAQVIRLISKLIYYLS